MADTPCLEMTERELDAFALQLFKKLSENDQREALERLRKLLEAQ